MEDYVLEVEAQLITNGVKFLFIFKKKAMPPSHSKAADVFIFQFYSEIMCSSGTSFQQGI